jgi:hypothetical protein
MVTRTYRVSVTDGQLTFRLADLGGSDWWAMICGLDVVAVSGQSQSIASTDAAEFDGPLIKNSRDARHLKSTARTTSHAVTRTVNLRSLDLLNSISLLSQSRQALSRDLVPSARDEAFAGLFDDTHEALGNGPWPFLF